MKSRLFWIAVGGLSFWLPAIVINTALDRKSNLWTLNVVPLAGVTSLAVASWISTKHLPKWGWVLAGIYILGPVLHAGSVGVPSRSVVSEYLWREDVDDLVLLVSSNDPLDGGVEWNAFLGPSGHRDPALPCGVSERP